MDIVSLIYQKERKEKKMFWCSLAVKLTPPPTALASSAPVTAEGRRRGIFRPISTTRTTTLRSCRPCRNGKSEEARAQEEEEEETFQVVTAMKSRYNDIVIVDSPKSRILLLDSTNNIHSILHKADEKWTGAYWDEFVSLPPIVPEGPIALYGLGGGTAAHLMLDVWPSLQIDGWEIDEILIDKAREYFGLTSLESCNEAGGELRVHVDDVFSPVQNLPQGHAAGIIVDLFSDGKVLPQLQEVETWLQLSDRLMPGGRIMVNCGGGSETSIEGELNPLALVNGDWKQNSTIKALATAFPGQVYWKRLSIMQGLNYLALTGPLPDFDSWSALVPDCLSKAVKEWRPCS